MRWATLPWGSETQISGSPVREEEKASLLPPGDQAGERLVPPTRREANHAAEQQREHPDLEAVLAERG